MSQGEPMPLAAASEVAERLVELLDAACERIEIAGSIRRRRPMVRDIELVAIGRTGAAGGLWGDADPVDLLELRIAELRADGVLALRQVTLERADGSRELATRDGRAYKALDYAGVPVDLFITDPERWAAILAIRTGPADFSQRLVTDCQRHFRRVERGRVLHLGRPVPTPTEEAFFRALGVPWVEPWERSVERLRFDPALLREGVA